MKSGTPVDEYAPNLPTSRQLPFKKAMRMQEWSRYPLETPEQLENWRQTYALDLSEVHQHSPGSWEELLPISQPSPRDMSVQASLFLPTEPQEHIRALGDQPQTASIPQSSPNTISDHGMHEQHPHVMYHPPGVEYRQDMAANLAENSTAHLPVELGRNDSQLGRSQRLSTLFRDTYY